MKKQEFTKFYGSKKCEIFTIHKYKVLYRTKKTLVHF